MTAENLMAELLQARGGVVQDEAARRAVAAAT
jgi:hypothetical protein